MLFVYSLREIYQNQIYKIFPEEIETLALRKLNNYVVAGFDLIQDGSNAIITPGTALVNGYIITSDLNTEIQCHTSSQPYFIVITLDRVGNRLVPSLTKLQGYNDDWLFLYRVRTVGSNIVIDDIRDFTPYGPSTHITGTNTSTIYLNTVYPNWQVLTAQLTYSDRKKEIQNGYFTPIHRGIYRIFVSCFIYNDSEITNLYIYYMLEFGSAYTNHDKISMRPYNDYDGKTRLIFNHFIYHDGSTAYFPFCFKVARSSDVISYIEPGDIKIWIYGERTRRNAY